MRGVVAALANDYDIVEVAAAAVKLVHLQLADGDAEEADLPPAPARDSRPSTRPQGGMRIFIGAGRQAGIRPGDLVGAITNEAGIASRDLGIVQIADRFSVVEVPEDQGEAVIAALKRTSLRGQRVTVRKDRDS
jgi:ATP-dependent RNA helicase DeaD